MECVRTEEMSSTAEIPIIVTSKNRYARLIFYLKKWDLKVFPPNPSAMCKATDPVHHLLNQFE
jgi:hypothetical protein